MDQEQVIHTASALETEAVGAALARNILNDPQIPALISLYGDLGVGKTAFVRGFTSVISPTSVVKSPTFALVREYPAKPRPVFHFDMYRIESEDDLISIGFDDYLNRNGICLIEWSEHIEEFLPTDRLRVSIEKDDPKNPDHRRITIKQPKEATT